MKEFIGYTINYLSQGTLVYFLFKLQTMSVLSHKVDKIMYHPFYSALVYFFNTINFMLNQVKIGAFMV